MKLLHFQGLDLGLYYTWQDQASCRLPAEAKRWAGAQEVDFIIHGEDFRTEEVKSITRYRRH